MTRLELLEVPTRTITLNDSRIANASDGYRMIEVATAGELAEHIEQVWAYPSAVCRKIANAVWAGVDVEMSGTDSDGEFVHLDCKEAGFSKKGRGFKFPALVNANTLAVDGLTYAEREDKWAKQDAAHKKLMDAHKARMEARQ